MKGGRGVYHASGKDSESFDYKGCSSGILRIAAFEEDKISLLSGNYQETVEDIDFLTSLETLQIACTTQTLDNDTSIIERFWRSLTANLTGINWRHPSKEYGARFRDFAYFQLSYLVGLDSGGTRQRIRSVLEYFHAHHDAADLPTWEDVTNSIDDNARAAKKENAEGYVAFVNSMFPYRRFFITAKGRMGIASQAAKVNDLIYIVKGSEFPLLMRRGSAGRLQFLSLAYVDGIMFGESLETNTFGTIEIE